MSLSSDQAHILTLTSAGLLYRVDASTLESVVLRVTPASPVRMISFSAPSQTTQTQEQTQAKARSYAGERSAADPLALCTLSRDGVLQLWSLTDSHNGVPSFIAEAPSPANDRSNVGGVCCVLGSGCECVWAGYTDGSLHCYALPMTAATAKKSTEQNSGSVTVTLDEHWKIQEAHRGALTCVCEVEGSDLVVTGGDDGVLRVWDTTTLECVDQFEQHKSPILHMIMDNERLQVVHTVGEDRALVSLDLRLGKRLQYCCVKVYLCACAYVCAR